MFFESHVITCVPRKRVPSITCLIRSRFTFGTIADSHQANCRRIAAARCAAKSATLSATVPRKPRAKTTRRTLTSRGWCDQIKFYTNFTKSGHSFRRGDRGNNNNGRRERNTNRNDRDSLGESSGVIVGSPMMNKTFPHMGGGGGQRPQPPPNMGLPPPHSTPIKQGNQRPDFPLYHF